MSSNVLHVIVLEASTAESMTTLINAHYKNEYEILGNMSVVHNPNGNRVHLFQTMVKYQKYTPFGTGPR